jgi:hypothetical protein
MPRPTPSRDAEFASQFLFGGPLPSVLTPKRSIATADGPKKPRWPTTPRVHVRGAPLVPPRTLPLGLRLPSTPRSARPVTTESDPRRQRVQVAPVQENYNLGGFAQVNPDKNFSYSQRHNFYQEAGGNKKHEKFIGAPTAQSKIQRTEDIVRKTTERRQVLRDLVSKYQHKDINAPDYDAFEDERNDILGKAIMTSRNDAPPAISFESNLDLIKGVIGDVDEVTLQRQMSRKKSMMARRREM